MLTKLISFVLIAGSLAAGAVAASTAYLPKLSAVPRPAAEADAEPLTLAAPAGVKPGTGGDEPLVKAGTTLTGEVLAQLEAAEPPVNRVKVKEFSLARWDLAWLFGVSVLGLAGGAGLVRLEARRHVASMAPRPEGAGGPAVRSPRATLVAAHAQLKTLASTRQTVAAGDRRQRILHELDDVRARYFEPFVDQRPTIVSAVGMSGYARVMDSFAGAERAFNRAWSAAADNYPSEAEECLHVGVARLAEAIERAPD